MVQDVLLKCITGTSSNIIGSNIPNTCLGEPKPVSSSLQLFRSAWRYSLIS